MELGLLQREVAQILGCDTTTVHGWEINMFNPTIRLIPGIIQFLGYIPNLFPTQTLGQKVVAYRMVRGLDQKKLASQLGIDPSTLGRFERDKAISNGTPIKKIKQFLLRLSWLGNK